MKFRVTPEERLIILRKSYGSGRTISDYLRFCALEKQVLVIKGADQIAAELRRIGGNLNQLTRVANAGLTSIVGLDGIKEEVKKVWQSLNSLPREVR